MKRKAHNNILLCILSFSLVGCGSVDVERPADPAPRQEAVESYDDDVEVTSDENLYPESGVQNETPEPEEAETPVVDEAPSEDAPTDDPIQDLIDGLLSGEGGGEDALTELLGALLGGENGEGSSEGGLEDILGGLLGGGDAGDLGSILGGLLGGESEDGGDGSFCSDDASCSEGFGCDVLNLPLDQVPVPGLDIPFGQCRATCDILECGLMQLLGESCCETPEYQCEPVIDIDNGDAIGYCRAPTEQGFDL